jgi:hypothetical protein
MGHIVNYNGECPPFTSMMRYDIRVSASPVCQVNHIPIPQACDSAPCLTGGPPMALFSPVQEWWTFTSSNIVYTLESVMLTAGRQRQNTAADKRGMTVNDNLSECLWIIIPLACERSFRLSCSQFCFCLRSAFWVMTQTKLRVSWLKCFQILSSWQARIPFCLPICQWYT